MQKIKAESKYAKSLPRKLNKIELASLKQYLVFKAFFVDFLNAHLLKADLAERLDKCL